MNRTHLTLLLAGALSLSLLAGCGSGSADADPTPTPDATQSITSAPEASPASTPEATSAPAESDAPAAEPETERALALSHSDVTLKLAGGSFVLKATGTDAALTYASSDEAVATVDEQGKVTAVAPGTATITVSAGAWLEAKCVVRCAWTEAAPSSTPAPSATPAPSTTSAPTAAVDLSAFYAAVTSRYEFPSSLEQANADLLDGFFPGLTSIGTKQRLVYINMMSMNNGEFALIQVTNSKDVDAVKAILQARVDYMVDGGAWYPAPTEQWTYNSRVVSNGNYVMMVVHEQCDSIVADFNALF